jgi:cellobiose phosphorylase
MLNPVNHGVDPATIAVYKVEPYVMAGDVHAGAQHRGRGGWTWYTGAAGWMYRLIVETLLGVEVEADVLRFTPRLPAGWDSYKVHYRYHTTHYHITFTRTDDGGPRLILDGTESSEQSLRLVDDGRDHDVELHGGRELVGR